jgi:hypothetical protein
MKCFGYLLGGALFAFTIAGCDSGGLQEGAPTTPITAESAQPPSFKDEMKRNAGNMGVKNKAARPKPSAAPSAPPAEEKKE